MKHLPVNTLLYKRYLESFKQSLVTLGYNIDNCSAIASKLQEFFFFLENKGIFEFTKITKQHTDLYLEHLKTRKAHAKEGALSSSHINGHIGMLILFSRYLKSVQDIDLPPPPEYLPNQATKERLVLTVAEIQLLYAATTETPFGLRDRAMLTVYYGCGLRLSEGARLSVDDLLFDRALLHVRKAKNGYERYVPMTKTGMGYLQGYITTARRAMLADGSQLKALFINNRGGKLSEESLYVSLLSLCKKAHLTKQIGVHTLRHSIATHLLQKNMDLDKIALFLGHRSLDSTQVYTHLAQQGNEGI